MTTALIATAAGLTVTVIAALAATALVGMALVHAAAIFDRKDRP